jgi:hypothetical protein
MIAPEPMLQVYGPFEDKGRYLLPIGIFWQSDDQF